MQWLCFLIIGVFHCADLFAGVLEQSWITGSGTLQVHCGVLPKLGDQEACRFACNGSISCLLPSPLCQNCAGTEALVVRKIFDQVGRSIQSDFRSAGSWKELAELLRSQRIEVFGSRSPFNFTTVWNSSELIERFESLCPQESKGTGEVLIVLQRDRADEPLDLRKLRWAICPDGKLFSLIYPGVPPSEQAQKSNTSQVPAESHSIDASDQPVPEDLAWENHRFVSTLEQASPSIGLSLARDPQSSQSWILVELSGGPIAPVSEGESSWNGAGNPILLFRYDVQAAQEVAENKERPYSMSLDLVAVDVSGSFLSSDLVSRLQLKLLTGNHEFGRPFVVSKGDESIAVYQGKIIGLSGEIQIPEASWLKTILEFELNALGVRYWSQKRADFRGIEVLQAEGHVAQSFQWNEFAAFMVGFGAGADYGVGQWRSHSKTRIAVEDPQKLQADVRLRLGEHVDLFTEGRRQKDDLLTSESLWIFRGGFEVRF